MARRMRRAAPALIDCVPSQSQSYAALLAVAGPGAMTRDAGRADRMFASDPVGAIELRAPNSSNAARAVVVSPLLKC